MFVEEELGMAGSWTADRFPQFEAAIRRLTEQHRELEDEPLHLAVAYQPGPGREQQHIYLFEVIGNSVGMGVSPDRELFETVFGPSSGFPMHPGERLHLVLTHPEEFRTAADEDWPSAREIVQAVRTGEYQVLYADGVGQTLLAELRELVGRTAGTTHG